MTNPNIPVGSEEEVTEKPSSKYQTAEEASVALAMRNFAYSLLYLHPSSPMPESGVEVAEDLMPSDT